LKEICLIINEKLMPQDLGDVLMDGQMYGRVQLYMHPTLWGHKNNDVDEFQ
jgi:hypothetical protein